MYFEDLKLNQKIEIAPAYIDKKDMIDFAHKYDYIPIHTDEDYARTTHFGKLIAPGVMSFMSVWAKYLESDIFGKELLAGKSTKIETRFFPYSLIKLASTLFICSLSVVVL